MVPAGEEAVEPEVAPPPSIAPPPPSIAPPPAPRPGVTPSPPVVQPADTPAGPGAIGAWPLPAARGRIPPPPSSRGPAHAIPPPVQIHPGPAAAAANGDLVDVVPRHTGGGPQLVLPHARRLRRSRPTEMPPRPTERYDLPEDSAGRVQYVEQPLVVEHPGAAPRSGVEPPPVPAPIPRADEIAGWIAVGALSAVLLIVFIIGMKLIS